MLNLNFEDNIQYIISPDVNILIYVTIIIRSKICCQIEWFQNKYILVLLIFS